MVPDAAWPGSDQWPWSTAPATGPVGRLGRPSVSEPWGVGSFLSLGRPTCVRCPGPLGSCSPVRPLGALRCVCGVLGHLAPVHRCARSGALLCLCGVLGHLAPVHWCARVVCRVVSAVSLATWLLFTGVPARCVVLRVGYPGPLCSCSPVCQLGVLLCVCGVLAQVTPVHRCARCVRRACAVGGCDPLPPPLIFFFVSVFFSFFVMPPRFFFGKNKKGGGRTLQAQAWATGAAGQ